MYRTLHIFQYVLQYKSFGKIEFFPEISHFLTFLKNKGGVKCGEFFQYPS